MSHESRLERLGLLHLKDDPEALAKETERRIAEFEKKLADLPPVKSPADDDAAHKQRWQAIGAEIAAKRQPVDLLTREERATQRAQAMVDALNRNVLAEHEADLAALPPEIRASRTPEEWLATPPLEILRLAAEAKAGAAAAPQAPPAPGLKGWARRVGEAIAARVRRATAGK